MSMDNRAIEQGRQFDIVPQSLKTAVFLARELVKTVFDTIPAQDAAKNAGEMVTRQLVMGQGNTDITSRFRGVIALPGSLEASRPTLDLTDGAADKANVIDLRVPPTPEIEAELQASISRHPAARQQ